MYTGHRNAPINTKRRCAQVVVADRFYASSKICAPRRLKVDELPLSVREWTCPACGATHDSDGNAAENLEVMAVVSRCQSVERKVLAAVARRRRNRPR
ncbi:zinc ribbon domain-containing protein [Cupriavidus sp. IK-TO18]|uniref:zinc ribbon domain-containing protein n=1 Tax=Cupriavidus sp. IK-TO18 TaxID=2782182 RepID=UPI0034CED1E5|nr:transposase [Cupriavidus sp. IK-TO18]